jgi:DNA-binding response OmpR family regulator
VRKTTILVVEDDVPILTGLVDLLEGEGYEVFPAKDGGKALLLYNEKKPDIVLLDIMIPDKSGYDVCREIRKKDPVTPVLMLTARGQEVDKVVGLELGADDYIVKPFGIQELLARIRASLRRVKTVKESGNSGNGVYGDKMICFGDVTIDPKTFKGSKGKREFPVTLREIRLMQLFMAHDGKVLNRFTILDEIWGIRYEGTTRTLDQHIAKLRQKIEDDPAHPHYIVTIHTVGYKFCSRPQ